MTAADLAQSIAANPYDDEGLFIEALRMFIAGVKVRAAAMADTPMADQA